MIRSPYKWCQAPVWSCKIEAHAAPCFYGFPPLFRALFRNGSHCFGRALDVFRSRGSRFSFHLYLPVGQSNMAGRGVVDGESKQPDPSVTVLAKSLEWKPATDPLHFDKPVAGVGPSLAFGKAMAAAAPDIRVGLVPCAVGGTSIKVWVPGAEDQATHTHPYSDMLARVLEVQKAGVLKGIIWHQGESDRASATPPYRTLLADLVGRIRTDLQTDAPFVAGEISSFDPANAEVTSRFNREVHLLESTLKKYGCVSSEGLNHKGDKLHYDALSVRILGKRYVGKLSELEK